MSDEERAKAEAANLAQVALFRSATEALKQRKEQAARFEREWYGHDFRDRLCTRCGKWLDAYNKMSSEQRAEDPYRFVCQPTVVEIKRVPPYLIPAGIEIPAKDSRVTWQELEGSHGGRYLQYTGRVTDVLRVGPTVLLRCYCDQDAGRLAWVNLNQLLAWTVEDRQ